MSKHIRARVFFVFAVFWLLACSTYPRVLPPRISFLRGVSMNVMSPASAGVSLAAAQRIEIRFLDKTKSINIRAQIEVIPEKSVWVGFSELGPRVFTLKQEGGVLSYDKRSYLRFEYAPIEVFRDLQLACWPIEEVRKSLEGNVEVKERREPKRGRVFLRMGQEVMRVSFQGENCWSGSSRLKNLERGYEMRLDSVVTGELG